MKPRILITGGTGLIGSPCVAAAVAAGFEPYVIQRTSPETADAARYVCVANLLDPGAVAQVIADVRPTVLLHLAWVTTHGAYWNAIENPQWVEASMQLLERFVENGGRRAVMAGTCAEYDWTGSNLRYHEFRTRIAPASLYGQAKDALRRRAIAYAEGSGLSLAWARLFFPYGPGENANRLIPSVARNLIAGRPAETTAGTQVRDLLYVSDVADALLALLASPVTGPVNIGSGESLTLRQAIEVTADIIGRPDLLRLGARPMPPGEPASLLADTGRLNHDVGWTPRVSLREGLTRAVAYWKRRNGDA